MIEALKAIVGDKYVKTEAADLQTYGRDWTKAHEPKPCAIVFPSTTEEVSKILAYCNKNNIKVVPSGGRTGLAAGAVAANNELVISMDRFNKIEHVDTIGLTVSVEAGVKTQAVQEAALEKGLFFGLDLASKGSCQVGGNIATNAGGTKLIRYGGMREQVLGLEVVLASGEVLDMNSSLRKNNSGYELKQLFIASEGTLGIITRATLRLLPKPQDLQLTCMSVSTFQNIPRILSLCNQMGVTLTAFEFFTKDALDIVLRYQKHLKNPFEQIANFYVIVEIERGPKGSENMLEPLLEKALELDLIQDGVISSSSTEFKELWGLRENISESISQYGHVRKNDISLPIDRLDDFVNDIEKILKISPKEIQLILFGHIGDGNLHINYVAPKTLEKDTFNKLSYDVERKIFGLLPSYKGSVSAEHGIGLTKKHDLASTRTKGEIDIMRQIKKVLDPKGIMNPGKIFD
jgi:FAD/FMN-containing dehydrogenase